MDSFLPRWVVFVCGWGSLVSIVVSAFTVYQHLVNYRKPLEQRLIVRIIMIVPLFAVTCFLNIRNETVARVIEPVREIYEAFVIYTFFSLLTRMLGGERRIVIFTSGREPVAHPGFMKWLKSPIDISDPRSFLGLKRGILQYVWVKPVLCVLIALAQLTGNYNVNDTGPASLYTWIVLVYNASVTVSLYCLALFWKCLYDDLKPFGPWGKFLCVKMIIFASYWQGLGLSILDRIGVLPKSEDSDYSNAGVVIQNALLCIELVGFAVGHYCAFNYREFSIKKLPDCARLQTWYAFKDWCSPGDLVQDFKQTLDGDNYGYRDFDSIEAVIAHPLSKSRVNRISQGMRYSEGGNKKYWLPDSNSDTRRSFSSSKASTRALYAGSILSHGIEEEEDDEELDQDLSPEQLTRDDKLYSFAKRHLPYGDSHYRVVMDRDSHLHSRSFLEQRKQAHERQILRSSVSYGAIN